MSQHNGDNNHEASHNEQQIQSTTTMNGAHQRSTLSITTQPSSAKIMAPIFTTNLRPRDSTINRKEYEKTFPTVSTSNTANKKKDKRKRTSPEQKPAPKQIKLKESWLNPVQNANRFSSLATEDENVEKQEEESMPKKIKPPPIFVAGVKEMKPLNMLLTEICKADYSVKILSNYEVKIQTTEPDDYRTMVSKLSERNTEFHTYKAKDLKNFRTVLRGLHPSTDISEIKAEIQNFNHKVASIHNIKKRSDGRPLPLFYVDLLPDINNKDIYNIKSMMHTKISFEAPHYKRDIPQCARCQMYGHTHKYCHRDARCVKCAGDHKTKDCKRNTRDNNVKCVLCSGNHPANYKGCQHYKDLQKKKFPPLRKKQVTSQHLTQTMSTEFTSAYPTNQLVQPNITYANVANGSAYQPNVHGPSYYQTQINEQNQHQSWQQQPDNQNTRTSDDINELKSLMKDLMGQISPLLNLLMTLVAKMK